MTRSFIKAYGIKLIVPLYMIFYLVAFGLLEERGLYRMHIIYTSLDYSIPFCEYFIIPYILWFFYIAFTVYWFVFRNNDRKECLQLIINLAIGMTLFLFISWIYPNGHFLRPIEFPRDNIFTQMVEVLYSLDTSTNILPSVHVYNSIAACIGILRCKSLQKKPIVVSSVCVLTIAIILATVFLKQHSIIDVVMAFVLNFVVYMLVYFLDDHKVFIKRKAYVRSANL